MTSYLLKSSSIIRNPSLSIHPNDVPELRRRDSSRVRKALETVVRRLLVCICVLDEVELAKSCSHESDPERQARGHLHEGSGSSCVDSFWLETERHCADGWVNQIEEVIFIRIQTSHKGISGDGRWG